MIKEIIKQIREQQQLAKRAVVPDPRTINTQLGNIKRAEENLSHLFIDLRNEVKNNLVLIIAVGKNGKEFAEIAQENYACLSFPLDGVYKKIASYVDDSFLGRAASPSIMDVAMSAMSDMGHEIGIVSYNYVQFKNEDSVFLKDRSDLEKLIQKSFNREIGAELATLKAVHDAAVKIMESDFEGKKVPVVLHTEDKDLAAAVAKDSERLTKRVFMINTNKKQTKESVENKLVELSSQAAEV